MLKKGIQTLFTILLIGTYNTTVAQETKIENEKEYIVLSKLKKDPEANTCTYKKGYIQQEVIFCQTCYIEKKLSSARIGKYLRTSSAQ